MTTIDTGAAASQAETGPEPALRASNLSVTYPDGAGGFKALQSVTFNLYPQQFVCLIGPSGSGKTTLLRVLAGVLPPTSGEVLVSTSAPDRLPCISLVFQDANLMPWRTVLQNILLPLDLAKVPKMEAEARARELVEQVGLKGFENAWPRDLSGGMAQRVAIARALIQDPDFLLLDEPFGALDALTRERMGTELLALWQAQRQTVFMVTHSIAEALLLSDRVLVLTPRPGRIGLDLPVNLPRPRREEIRYTPEFGALAGQLKEAIH